MKISKYLEICIRSVALTDFLKRRVSLSRAQAQGDMGMGWAWQAAVLAKMSSDQTYIMGKVRLET